MSSNSNLNILQVTPVTGTHHLPEFKSWLCHIRGNQLSDSVTLQFLHRMRIHRILDTHLRRLLQGQEPPPDKYCITSAVSIACVTGNDIQCHGSNWGSGIPPSSLGPSPASTRPLCPWPASFLPVAPAPAPLPLPGVINTIFCTNCDSFPNY